MAFHSENAASNWYQDESTWLRHEYENELRDARREEALARHTRGDEAAPRAFEAQGPLPCENCGELGGASVFSPTEGYACTLCVGGAR